MLTHEIPEALKHCQPYVSGLFPRLLEANLEGINQHNIGPRMELLIIQYGNHFVIDPMPVDGVLPGV